MTEIRITDIAEDAICAPARNVLQRAAAASALLRSGQFEEVVPGIDSLTVRFDPITISRNRAADALTNALTQTYTDERGASETVTISVRYGGEDGPDFDPLCQELGISSETLISLHSNALYTVDLVGFMPGFAYMSGLDPRLSVARKATPRARVPAGSVAITAGFSGIYPLPSPGGWPLIGRTDAPLFRPEKADPFFVKPGDRVRFEPA